MIFLVEYKRTSNDPAKLTEFANDRIEEAQNKRLELELAALARGEDVEIVLLEAQNQAAIRKTHRRYFESLEQFIRAPLLGVA